MRYDTGDYPQSVRLCAELLNLFDRASPMGARHRLRQLQRADRTRRRRIPLRDTAIIPRVESSTARSLPDGRVVLMVGTGRTVRSERWLCRRSPVGNGHPSSADLDPARRRGKHRLGFGTFASRSMALCVMSCLRRQDAPAQHAALRSRHTSGSVPDGTRGRRPGHKPRTEPAPPEQPDAARRRTPGAAGRSRR